MIILGSEVMVDQFNSVCLGDGACHGLLPKENVGIDGVLQGTIWSNKNPYSRCKSSILDILGNVFPALAVLCVL